MAVEFISGDQVESKIAEHKLLVLNVFATWCGPCKMMAPILDEVSEQYKVVKVDLDTNQAFAAKEGVSGVPTTKIYRDGKLVDTIVGFAPKEKLLSVLTQG